MKQGKTYYFVGYAPPGAVFQCFYSDTKITYMLLEPLHGDGRGHAVKVLTLQDDRFGRTGIVDFASIIEGDVRIA